MNSDRGSDGLFGGGRGGAVRPGGIGGVVGGTRRSRRPRRSRWPGGRTAPAAAASTCDRRRWMSSTACIDMGVDVNHQLTRKRPYGNGRGRFSDYDMRDGVGPAVPRRARPRPRGNAGAARARRRGGPAQRVPDDAADDRGRHAGHGPPRRSFRRRRCPRAPSRAWICCWMPVRTSTHRSPAAHTHSATIMAYVAGRDQEGKTALMAAAEDGDSDGPASAGARRRSR